MRRMSSCHVAFIPLLRAVIAAQGNAAKLFNNHVYFLLF